MIRKELGEVVGGAGTRALMLGEGLGEGVAAGQDKNVDVRGRAGARGSRGGYEGAGARQDGT